jgi:hypothetical protein
LPSGGDAISPVDSYQDDVSEVTSFIMVSLVTV